VTFLDKKRLLQTSFLGGLMFAAAPAFAQTTPTPIDAEDDVPVVTAADDIEDFDDEFDEDEDTVVVTGSRLRRDEFSSVSPLQVIDGELSRDLGLVDAADLLSQTTVVQGQQITTGVSTSAGLLSDSGPGSATASLRGLDASRTLVLINGRRLAPAGVRGVPSAPDLNLIPGTLIQRVDVLLDGASSVYGSDAVAGVVNYQLQRDFEGIELEAFATLPELPGNAGHQEVFSVKFGVSNDRGFISGAVEHSRVDGFAELDLADFYEPYSYGCRGNIAQGVSGTIYRPDTCVGSFGAGSVSGGTGFLGYELGRREPGLPDNFFRIPISGDLLQPDSANGRALLLFPEELDAQFAPNFQRTSLFTFGEYDTGLYGNMTAYFEGSYAERRSDTSTAGQGAIDLPGDYGPSTFGVQTSLFFQSRFENQTNVAQARFVGGLKGDLPFLNNGFLDNWGYDVYGSYSRSSGQDSVSGIPFLPRLEQTLSNTRFDPTTGEFVCDPRSIPGNGQQIECRPLNFFEPSFLFEGRFNDPDDTAFLFPNRLTDTVVSQTVFSGYLAGDLFNIPWGDTVLLGLGAEYREDTIETRTALAGDFEGFSNDPGANGNRSFTEVFGEIEIPLIQDMPFVDTLTLNGAARYTEESNFGDEVTYSIKGQYGPTDWLTFQATYGTSFRAPSVGEQFGGAVTGFQNPVDPCRVPGIAVPFTDFDNDPTTPDTRNYDPSLDPRGQDVIDRCLNGGGPFNIPGTDPFSLGVVGLGGSSPVFLGAARPFASGSNPDLNPETSNAFSAGVTFEQPWLDDIDFRLAVTYYEIEVNDEIDQLLVSTIVNRCYNSAGLTDPTCGFLTRSPRVPGDDQSGLIDFVSALNQNLGQQIVEGLDYNWEFGFDTEPSFLDSPIGYRMIGRATQSLTQTEELITQDATLINRQDGENNNPEWRLNLTNVLSYENFRFLWQSRYLSSTVENFLNEDDDQTTGLAGDVDIDPITTGFSRCVQAEGRGNRADGFNCIQLDGVDDYWVHDASIAFSQDTYSIRVGINNVFNDAPPLTNNNALSQLGGGGYDLRGRTFFANVTKRF
jgi:iron complex outermembrane receptor protein